MKLGKRGYWMRILNWWYFLTLNIYNYCLQCPISIGIRMMILPVKIKWTCRLMSPVKSSIGSNLNSLSCNLEMKSRKDIILLKVGGNFIPNSLAFKLILCLKQHSIYGEYSNLLISEMIIFRLALYSILLSLWCSWQHKWRDKLKSTKH